MMGSLLGGIDNQFAASDEVMFEHNVVDMNPDGGIGNLELVGNLGVGEALAEEGENGLFPAGEGFKCFGRRGKSCLLNRI